MNGRTIVLLALGATISAAAGCQSAGDVGSARPGVILAGAGVAAVVASKEPLSGSAVFRVGHSLRAGETHEFTEGMHLHVHYRTTPPDGHERRARFSAYAAPLPKGGPFSLTLHQSVGDLGAGPLLTIANGAMIVRGRNPAVGGSETGTWGEGTTFIFESSDRDYIYLLDDPDGATHALRVYRLSDSADAVDIIPGTALGEVRGYRWAAPGNTHDPDNQEFVKHGDYRDDPHRRAIHDALRGMLP